jgi:HTH-type transcriptional regulator/antitoxin HigA
MTNSPKDLPVNLKLPLTSRELKASDFVAGAAVPTKDFLVTSDEQLQVVIERMIALEEGPNPAENQELTMLAAAVEAYETAQGHAPAPPVSLRGILEVEMFKRRIRQRQLAEILGVTEPRLSELMKGKRALNMDFARRLYTKLQLPAEVIFSIASKGNYSATPGPYLKAKCPSSQVAGRAFGF